MKTKKYIYAPHKTGFTREQHALLRRGEVLVIDHEGCVGAGHLPENANSKAGYAGFIIYDSSCRPWRTVYKTHEEIEA